MRNNAPRDPDRPVAPSAPADRLLCSAASELHASADALFMAAEKLRRLNELYAANLAYNAALRARTYADGLPRA